MVGTLYIVSAPSGCGKTSLVNRLLSSMDQICVSISYTTRPARPGEISGINYYFVSENAFQDLISNKAFLEYAQVFGYYYGTQAFWVEEQLNKGIDVILEIDWQGAQQIKKKLPQAIGIFLLPPSLESLYERLKNRGKDSQQTIAKRMSQANSEISHYKEYDYIIVNNHFENAINDFITIINAQRLTTNRQIHDLGKALPILIEGS